MADVAELKAHATIRTLEAEMDITKPRD